MAAVLFAIPSSEPTPSPCIVPSAEAIRAADTFLHQPEDPMVTRYNNWLTGKGDAAANDAIDASQYREWTAQKAAELGLTQHLFDPDAHIEEQTNVTKSRAATSQFLAQYGIELSFGDTPGEMDGIDGRPTTEEERNSKEMALHLVLLNQQVSKYPVEFLRKLHHTKIVMMRGLPIKHGDGLGGTAAGEVSGAHPGDVFLDFSAPPLVYDHEVGHLVDTAESCITEDDPALIALNQGNIYGPSEKVDTISLERVERSAAVISTPDQKQTVLNQKRAVRTMTDYGTTNRPEDVAEIHKDLLRGFFGRYTADLVPSPILEDKTRLQLARLYTLDADTTRFLAATSYHGHPGKIRSLE